MLKLRLTYPYIIFIILFSSCEKETNSSYFSISGTVVNQNNEAVADIEIKLSNGRSVFSDSLGHWQFDKLTGKQRVSPISNKYNFKPSFIDAVEQSNNLRFEVIDKLLTNEEKILNWFRNQQLKNGLLESVENGNVVSLYDNALAAMVFMLNKDYGRAKQIFDFFLDKKDSELQMGQGGYSQFRDRNGIPNNHRWMGDNAWLLIALNNFKDQTHDTKYDDLRASISNWLIKLQANDGGLYAGYGTDNNLLNYKVTEGNLDAFNAIEGYNTFHKSILQFLENDRWDKTDRNIVSWPDNPTYKYALDCHSWSYCMFPNYPLSALTTANRFKTTKTATVNEVEITGFDTDEDKDHVFMEGTGQMMLAFKYSDNMDQYEKYKGEMEKLIMKSLVHENSWGLPYASNFGTGYGSDPHWSGVDTQIAIAGSAWYLFAKFGFNPFEVGRNKDIPKKDKFWQF